MLAYLHGILVRSQPGVCVVDLHGFGLRVVVPISEGYQHLKLQEKIRFHTHLHQKEDGSSVYGFLTTEELELFQLLISVSGIGPRNALNMLSYAAPSLISQWLLQEDVASLKKVPGIGIKTAQRMILELKSKVSGFSWSNNETDFKSSSLASDPNSEFNQAIEALLVLGYDLREATKQVRSAAERHPDAKVEGLIKEALQMLLRI